jgi:RNA polymerase sigma factor (sigma-70 family)
VVQIRKFSDQEIIIGLKAGEAFAVNYLAKEYLPMIRYFISKNNGSDEDAKDIFQDALFILIDKINSKDFNLQVTLSTYLFAICKNLWLMVLDRQKAARNYEKRRSSDVLENDFTESGDIAFYERIFRQCFDAMDDVSQKILKMYWMEIAPTEIAEKLGYSYGYVRKKKSECMKELKNRIMNHPDYRELESNLNIK